MCTLTHLQTEFVFKFVQIKDKEKHPHASLFISFDSIFGYLLYKYNKKNVFYIIIFNHQPIKVLSISIFLIQKQDEQFNCVFIITSSLRW